ncbi:hypothetical protein A2Y99_00175 [Candidatus Gottesmanbacteria bacterium RBG_13_37_7]|uniref:hydroxymethylglutaryl-CoA reductase (NADPH) n=1 Tax=Candidatus Gottesmanbacteria bacterium RBG_13_37_7 TaxID=1798369 RepID=A0A1F5YH94_9BACT|nr:MAG: hypothetical protein A2Y99_00175 [Candidatus Gottesmanbacteria bacterium RBG_13_37_7]
MNLRNHKNIIERRRYLGEKIGCSLASVGIYPQGLQKAGERNCENMIGATQIPLGIAGPITIRGRYATGDFFLPLATTEGALVASVNRGCKAVTLSKGVSVYQEYVGITRGVALSTGSVGKGMEVKKWISQNQPALAEITRKTSNHLNLIRVDSTVVADCLFIRLYFDSQDAMGMNMATIASDAVIHFLEKKQGIKCVSLAGNYDIDKKPAWLNFILGRGRKVWAEVIIPEAIVRTVLKTTSEKINQVAISKCYLGSIMSGSMGFNAHFANIIAAVFTATGQDIAHTVEGSLGVTSTQVIEDNLHISVYLPDLIIGTVGGGTGLPAQEEALKIMGINRENKGNSAAFYADIITGAVLAGEVSLLAALSEGSLAASHQKLARGKK